jgi:transaldolase
MTANASLASLRAAGVSIWLDTLSRDLLERGDFARLVRDDGVTGATSNPAIFARAIAGSDRYDAQLHRLAAEGVSDPRELFFAPALDDVRTAADQLRDVHEATGGADGFVSFECTPDIADDTEATIEQATDLWHRLDRPNVMIKVPGTAAGLPAVEELTRRGININITLLFSIARYEQVVDAYLRGLRARALAGEPLAPIRSVASFFLSRIDTKADARLAPGSPLRGRAAVASARVAYQRYRARFSGPAWEALRELGAHPQRPLWASTGTKDPGLSDVLYVAELIGADVISTMPLATLRAFADHGVVARTLDRDPDAARRTLADLAAAGVDLEAITAELEREGVQAFDDAYRDLLATIERKVGAAADVRR